MKKIFSAIFVLLAFLITISGLFGFTTKKIAFAENVSGIEFKSKSIYLMDSNTGTVICSENEEKQLPIASMCKIMTLLLCFEECDNGNLDFNEEITVSNTAAGMGGSQVFLEANGKYKVSELIKSIVVASANDACVAMAERICGSQSSFVDKMNERANELEMNNTVFVNCTGLPQPGQYSCTKDVAKMFNQLLTHEEYFEYSKIWMDKIQHKNDRITEISNTNKLVKFYNGCDSGKTGYTSEAGHCLAASAIRSGMRLVAVVISSPDSKTRFNEVSSMFNYGFANYVNKKIIDENSPLEIKVDVVGGKKDVLEVIAERPSYIFSHKNEKRAVEIEFTPTTRVKAPIKKGEVVGQLNVYENGKEIDCVNVIANESILQKTYFDVITDIGKNWALI